MPLDPNFWACCMLTESIKAPPLYPEDFLLPGEIFWSEPQ